MSMRSSASRLAAMVITAGLAAGAPAFAADKPLRDMSTDRPDDTESPYTVDAGHIQFETTLAGASRSRRDESGVASDGYEFGTTNLRIGLTDRLEVDAIFEPYGVSDPDGAGGRSSGVGGLTLRTKLNLMGADGADKAGDVAIGLLPFVNLPLNRRNGIGPAAVEYGFILPVDVGLGHGWSVGLNAEVLVLRQDPDGPYDPEFLTSASFSKQWTPKLGTYYELAAELSRRDPLGDIVKFDTGATYALTPNLQVDAGVELGLTRASDRVGGFVGVSMRF